MARAARINATRHAESTYVCNVACACQARTRASKQTDRDCGSAFAVVACSACTKACSGVSIALSSLFANILLHEGAIPLGSVKVVARLLQKHIWKWRWLPEHTGHNGDDEEAGRCHWLWPSRAVDLKFASSIYKLSFPNFENCAPNKQTNTATRDNKLVRRVCTHHSREFNKRFSNLKAIKPALL